MLSGLLLVWLLLVRLCPDAEILGDKSWSRSSARLKSSLSLLLEPKPECPHCLFSKSSGTVYIPPFRFHEGGSAYLTIT